MLLLERAAGLLVPPFCWACGAGARMREPLCRPCRRKLRWLGEEAVTLAGVEVWAAVAYDGPARALVRGLKYRGALGLAAPLAAQMAAAAPSGLFAAATVLVPVPLDPARRRRRGFNQAERLAEQLARRTGSGVADCLARRPGAGRQVGRDRAARLGALSGALWIDPRSAVPRRVVLVDDVATTGATLGACARQLRAAGCEEVSAAVYARTPGR